MTAIEAPCLLCGAAAPFAARAANRPVYACPVCGMRFVPPSCHVSRDEEETRYRLHRNTIEDAGYVRFLSAAVEALKRWLPCRSALPGARQDMPEEGRPAVLDYGSGPGPVLVELLRRAGYDAAGYDPFFSRFGETGRTWDAVVSTEVFEHFREPAGEIGRIVRLIRPGGLLVVMTSFYSGQDLASWHYSLDTTHVCFYSASTFEYMAHIWRFKMLETNGNNVVVLRRESQDRGMASCSCLL